MEFNTTTFNNMIVTALRHDSLKAFNTVYSLYAGKLLNYMGNAARFKEDAEEVVHDIFMEFWNNRHKLTEDINIQNLLFSIAQKRRIDMFRKSLRLPIFQDCMDFQDELATNDDNNLEYIEFCKRIENAISKLPERIQEFVVLSRIYGLSNNEIAARLQVSEKTVRNGISCGLKLLKAHL